MGCIPVYSNTVIYQIDQKFVRNNWEDISNAIGGSTASAMGSYTKFDDGTVKKPHKVYAYDFDLDIPENAYVKSVKFEVRMKCSRGLNVEAPNVTFMSYQSNIQDSSTVTGWHGGAFRVASAEKLSTSWKTISYTMSESDTKKHPNIVKSLNNQKYGLLMAFKDSINNTTGNIYLQWVRICVNYEMPDTYLMWSGLSEDYNDPTNIEVGDTYQAMVFFGNRSNSTGDVQTLKLEPAFGAEILSVLPMESKVNGRDAHLTNSFNPETNEWTVSCMAHSECSLLVTFIPRAGGFKQFFLGNDTVGHYGAYYYGATTGLDNFEGVNIIPKTLRRGEESCFDVYMQKRSSSSHEYVNDTILIGLESVVSSDLINIELNEELSSEGVVLREYEVVESHSDVVVHITIPTNQDVDVVFTVCYYPRISGETQIIVGRGMIPVTILDAYEKHILFNGNREEGKADFEIKSNRIVTQVEGDLVILPIKTDLNDTNLYIDESTFKINQWKKRRYIGCVEVPYSHYDPKNTTKDKLLDEHYKNKEYVGKENNVDETITLNIKLPKKKVPTIQGLIKVDRPIPVNLIPWNWEGDPLNHRGWAEIYGVDIEQTNPLYYKCDIDLKYITHDIISRFNIFSGSAINSFKLPNVLEHTLASGEDIGEYFDVITDGTYLYDGSENVTHRNLFSFTNGQSISLIGKNTLSSKSEFSLYWDSVLFSEIRENNITRTIKLVDENDNVVFRYEYYDFDFDSSVYSCRVVGQVLTEHGYNPLINREVYIHSDVEYTEDESDSDYDNEAIDIYGSHVDFKLDANRLTIRELGFSGCEFEQTVELLTGNYRLEIEVQNKNNDSDTGNILTWFDFDIAELSFDSKLSAYYQQLLVSPYPVPRKEVVFTRECAEGTIYYLKNDGGDFDFLLEPFYQYLCGVDLKAEDTSIFDFDNSYPIVYIDNGLIRFGVNRLNGDLYLDKWDYYSKSYIRTNRFRVEKYDKCGISTINDDIIVATISDLTVTMWRGRPYVMLQHETEDIAILDTFNQVYADGVNDNILHFPSYFNLLNGKNLLPECIGGTNLIKSSCITGTEITPSTSDFGTLTLSVNKTQCATNEEITCTFSGGNFSDGDIVLVSDKNVIGENTGSTMDVAFSEEGVYTLYAIYKGTSSVNYAISNNVEIMVEKAELFDNYVLVPTFNPVMNYNEGEFTWKLTNNGSPVQDMTIIVYTPTNTWHLTTGADGVAHGASNTGIWKIPTGEQLIRAEVYDNGEELVGMMGTWVTINKTTPKIKGGVLSLAKGGNCSFRLVDANDNPIGGATVSLNIGGTNYTRKSSVQSGTALGGYIKVKMSKEGTYTAKVTYAGDNGYNKAEGTFTVVVT